MISLNISEIPMHRAVTRSGRNVEFCNAAAGVVGKPYKYKCATIAQAKTFAKYCSRSDPDNPNWPIAVGPEVAADFNAVKIS